MAVWFTTFRTDAIVHFLKTTIATNIALQLRAPFFGGIVTQYCNRSQFLFNLTYAESYTNEVAHYLINSIPNAPE